MEQSSFSTVADEIKQWSYDRVWDHPPTSYTQQFQGPVDSLHQLLQEGGEKWTEDPTITRAQTVLQAFVAELSRYDEDVGNLEKYTMFERAEYATRITHWLVTNRFTKTASDRVSRRVLSLHGSFLSKITSRDTVRNTKRPWRELIDGLRSAIDGYKTVTDREARSGTVRCLDELTKAAQEIEHDVTDYDPVRSALDVPLATVRAQQAREGSVLVPVATQGQSAQEQSTMGYTPTFPAVSEE